jgi:hypothetical protein
MEEQNAEMIVLRVAESPEVYNDKPVRLLGLPAAVEILWGSGFMKDFFIEAIIDALKSGRTFEKLNPRVTYRLAKPEEVAKIAKEGLTRGIVRTFKQFQEEAGSGPDSAPSKKSSTTVTLILPKGEKQRAKVIESLPKGHARVFLEILSETGDETFTLEGLGTVLEAGRHRIKAREGLDLVHKFKVLYRERYEAAGLVKIEAPEENSNESENE